MRGESESFTSQTWFSQLLPTLAARVASIVSLRKSVDYTRARYDATRNVARGQAELEENQCLLMDEDADPGSGGDGLRYDGEEFLAVDIKRRRSNPKVKRTGSRSIVRTRQNPQPSLTLTLTDSTCHVELSRSQHRSLTSDTRSLSLGRLQTSMLESLKFASNNALSRVYRFAL